MKKILFILVFIYTAFSYGQGGPKVDAIRFKGDVTTTVRDAIDVPVGETWLIYNVTTDKVEFASSDDVWHDLTQLPLIDDDNLASATATNVASAESVKAYVDFYAVKMFGGAALNESADFGIRDTGTGVAGFTIDGTNDRARMSGGTVGSQVNFYVGPDGVYSLDQSNAVIDAFGDYAFTTKLYNDTNYISQDSIVDSDTFASVSPTTVPSSESVKAYIDASISGSGAVPDDTGSSNGDVLTTDGAGTYTWQTPTTGSSPPFDDNSALVRNNVDTSKLLDFDLSGLTTATTRTLTMPDADVDLGNMVSGPASATDNAIARFDATTGKIIQNSTATLSDIGILTASILTASTRYQGADQTDAAYAPGTSSGGIMFINNGMRLATGTNTNNLKLTYGALTSLGTLAFTDSDVTWNGSSLFGTDDQTASEVTSTATGTVAATNVDAAIAELASEKINTTISGRTGTAINSAMFQTQAQYNSDGAPGSNELVIITDASDYIEIALSDYTTDLTTGTSKAYFRAPFAMTITGVRASVLTAPTGANINIDINEGGVSIFSTVLSIDATEKTSTTAATAAVVSDTSIADDAELTFDIDQVGSTVAGVGLLVKIYYQ